MTAVEQILNKIGVLETKIESLFILVEEMQARQKLLLETLNSDAQLEKELNAPVVNLLKIKFRNPRTTPTSEDRMTRYNYVLKYMKEQPELFIKLKNYIKRSNNIKQSAKRLQEQSVTDLSPTVLNHMVIYLEACDIYSRTTHKFDDQAYQKLIGVN